MQTRMLGETGRSGRRRIAGLLFAAGLLGCFSERQDALLEPLPAECETAGDAPAAGATEVFVAMRDFEFQPAEMRVAAGTAVTWVNCERPNIDAHTTTSDADVWASPAMAAGARFRRVFEQPGRFEYHCVPHPFMRGAVIVE